MNKNPLVSVLILTKNEEENIEECIKSVSFADEILICDDFSSDKTCDIAARLGAKVEQRKSNGDLAAQRNFLTKKAKNKWVFWIDADERPTEEFVKSLMEIVRKNEDKQYFATRKSIAFSQKFSYGVLKPDRVVRLIPKNNATYINPMHESISSNLPTGYIKGFMWHYTYKNWEQYFEKMCRYSTLSAKSYREKNRSCNFFKDILMRPFLAFLKTYFLQLGFLEGKLGFILSVYHAEYTMSKYVKLHYSYKNDKNGHV